MTGNDLHSDLIEQLVKMFDYGDDQDLPTSLENDLYLSLTKFRALTYNIQVLESDEEIIRKARRSQVCHQTTAQLASSLISLELSKLKLGVSSQDWWFGEFTVLRSKNEPTRKQVGNLQLTPWDNVQVPAGPDWSIQDLIDHMQGIVGLTVDMITQNSKLIYMKALPTHANKKKKS